MWVCSFLTVIQLPGDSVFEGNTAKDLNIPIGPLAVSRLQFDAVNTTEDMMNQNMYCWYLSINGCLLIEGQVHEG